MTLQNDHRNNTEDVNHQPKPVSDDDNLTTHKQGVSDQLPVTFQRFLPDKEQTLAFIIGVIGIVIGGVLATITQAVQNKTTDVGTMCNVQGVFTGGESTRCVLATGGLSTLWNILVIFTWLAFIVGGLSLLVGIVLVYNAKHHEWAIAREPDNPQVYINRGLQYLKSHKLDKALADYQAALEIDPNNASAINGRGAVYQGKRQYSKALTDFARAVSLAPDKLLYKSNFDKLDAKVHQRGTPESYDWAIEQAPDNPIGYTNRSLYRTKHYMYDDALADCDKVLKLDPRNASAHNTRGVVYQRKKDYVSAAAEFKRAIALAPNEQMYKNNLVKNETLLRSTSSEEASS